MAKHKLNALKVDSMKPGKIGDGDRLWFHKKSSDTGRWYLLFRVDGGRVREMGLGPWPAVSLKEARELADVARAQIRAGIDPIAARDAPKPIVSNKLTDVAEACFESIKADLKGDGVAGNWYSPLRLHVLPKLGEMNAHDITQHDIVDTLNTVWHSKAPTALKAIDRLNIVMKYAVSLSKRGDPEIDITACQKARVILGRQRHKTVSIPSLHYNDTPAFYQSLILPTSVHLALRLLILTGLRSAAIRNARTSWIDGDVMTVPAEFMKGRVDATAPFRVSLSSEALAVIAQCPDDGLLFPGRRGRGQVPISDMSLSKMMRDRDMAEKPHGFRSSLRTWLAEQTSAPEHIAETILQHVTGTATSRAYRRSDDLENRRVYMNSWSDHVAGRVDTKKVLPFAAQS